MVRLKTFILNLAVAAILLPVAVVNQADAGFTIDFDDLAAPSLFSQQTPLAEEYASQGVHFSGTGEVLNSSSNFGVSLGVPFSAPNFLAFNDGAGAFPPETITFDFLVSSVSLDFAGSTGSYSLTGFLGGNQVATASQTSTSSSAWSSLALVGGLFDKIVFDVSGTDGTFVVDNLGIETGAVPEPASIAMWGLGIVGIGFSVRRRKRQQMKLAA